MDIKEESLCRICFKSGDLEVVDESLKEILDYLLLHIDFLPCDQLVICKSCYDNLRICYDFKSTYMSVGDSEDVYFKDSLNSDEELYGICRFCAQQVEKDTCTSLNALEKNLVLTRGPLDIYIPEINIRSANYSVICSYCLESLQHYINLKTACWKVEEDFKKYLELTGKSSEEKIEFSELVKFIFESSVKEEFQNNPGVLKEELEDTKSGDGFMNVTVEGGVYLKEQDKVNKEDEECGSPFSSMGIEVESATSPLYNEEPLKCIVCTHTSQSPRSWKRHLLTHKLYKCGTCAFSNKIMHQVKYHRRRHSVEDRVVAPVCVCEICGYESKTKSALNTHLVAHGKKEKLYKCNQCTFGTNRKFNFSRHVAGHLPLNESATFLCEICSYMGKDKSIFERHMYTHNVTDGLTLYNCDICSYVSPKRDHVTRHKIIHEKKSVKWYTCEYCDYKTDHRYSLRQHRLEHVPEDSLGNIVFKCKFCIYETKRSSHYQRHILTHESGRYDSNCFSCHLCEYKSNQKFNFKRHLKTHEPQTEEEVEVFMYKCDVCGYQTKQKGHLNRHSKIHE